MNENRGDVPIVVPPGLTRGAAQRPPKLGFDPPPNMAEAVRQRDHAADQARALANLVAEIMQTIHSGSQHPGQWQRCASPFCLAVRQKGTAIGYPGME